MLIPHSFVRASDFNAMGDVGCRSAAISNLKNLAGKSISFFGIGDYSYKCSSGTIKPLYDKINSKKLALGNHSCEKSGQDALRVGDGTYFSNGGCKKGYGVFVRGGNTAVFLLNQYTSYKPGSTQYKFVTDNLVKYSNMSNIDRIVFIFHEPIYPVNCTGSHCHGVEKPAFKSTYEPLIKKYHALVIQAHTHLVSFGTINGVESAICGGGGENGTGLNGLGAYTYVSKTMGYCNFHIDKDKVVAQLIGTSGNVVHVHTWHN